MISKATISFIQSLKQKKYRQKYNKFILEGDKIILEAIKEARISFDSIFCLPEKLHLFEGYNVSLIEINAKTLDKISNLKTAPGILAVANIPTPIKASDIRINKMALYLDDIKDPGNLGTIIRTAEWFGVETIIASAETVELHNPKVIQASMGSFARMKYVIADLKVLKDQQPNLKVVGSVLGGQNLYDYKPPFPLMLVIGNESRGISETILKLCDDLLEVPMAVSSKAESLNAAVANAVFLSYFSQGH